MPLGQHPMLGSLVSDIKVHRGIVYWLVMDGRARIVDARDLSAMVTVHDFTPGFTYASARPIALVGDSILIGRLDAGISRYENCALSLFSIFADGFESGDTSAWTAVVE